jgi:hypothetical protein
MALQKRGVKSHISKLIRFSYIHMSVNYVRSWLIKSAPKRGAQAVCEEALPRTASPERPQNLEEDLEGQVQVGGATDEMCRRQGNSLRKPFFPSKMFFLFNFKPFLLSFLDRPTWRRGERIGLVAGPFSISPAFWFESNFFSLFLGPAFESPECRYIHKRMYVHKS